MSATATLRNHAPLERVYDTYQRKLHEAQKLLYETPAKRKIVRAGRRFGKTNIAAHCAVQAFIRGGRVLYAVPTSDQVTRFWSEVTWCLRNLIEARVVRIVAGLIEWPGKSARIRARTAWSADGLRGDYADCLILDEFQLMHESAWGEVGAPMLIDNNGDALFIYTPPSMTSVGVSKADDIHHAKKMFAAATRFGEKQTIIIRVRQGDGYQEYEASYWVDPSGRWFALHAPSMVNPYLSKQGLQEVAADMTKLAYRQEILAEDIDEVPGALWTRKLIEDTRVTVCPPLKRAVVAVDPSGSATGTAGIVGVGQGFNDHLYIVRDVSVSTPTPRVWASRAVDLYREMKADRIIGERNYGGDMVRSIIESVDPAVPYRDVTATRGKMLRAEPVSARFEQGKIHIVGSMPELEEQAVSFVPGQPSPDRLDAMVHGCVALITIGMIFGESWTAQNEFTDETMPPNLPLQGSHEARFIVVKYGAATPICFLDVIDDGKTYWVYREHHFDPAVAMRQYTDQEYAAAMKEFIGKITNAEVLLPANCESFGRALRDEGVWFREAEKEKDDAAVRDTIRLMAGLIGKMKLRVHQRCVNTLSQIQGYQWGEATSAQGVEIPNDEHSECCVALRTLVQEKCRPWRLE